MAAARSDPAKSHDYLPRATPRSDLSAALLVRQMRPPLRNEVTPDQCFGDSRYSIALATLACFESSARSERSQRSRSATSGPTGLAPRNLGKSW